MLYTIYMLLGQQGEYSTFQRLANHQGDGTLYEA
jgi:hypothetical protein